MDTEELLNYARKNYPVGTTCFTPYSYDCIITTTRFNHSSDGNVYHDDGRNIIYDNQQKKWATIISSPKRYNKQYKSNLIFY
jgi:hypothetical protein